MGPKRFGQKQHLKRHVENVHLGRREHSCQLCTKSFAQRANLESHQRAMLVPGPRGVVSAEESGDVAALPYSPSGRADQTVLGNNEEVSYSLSIFFSDYTSVFFVLYDKYFQVLKD